MEIKLDLESAFVPVIIRLESQAEVYQLKHCLNHYKPNAGNQERPVEEFRQNFIMKLKKF